MSARKRKAKDAFEENTNNDIYNTEITKNLLDESEAYEHCKEWDKNSKILNLPIKSKRIVGFHLMPTCLPEPKPKNKQLVTKATLEKYLLNDFKTHWNLNKSVNNDNFEIITFPWKICVIKELFKDTTILKMIRQEFYELNWNRRKMDLYDFHQSEDLKNVKLENLELVYNYLRNDLMPLIGHALNLNLTHISATCSFYTDTDFLLVHDDKRGDRVVAFVLYLSDVYDWKKSWGGALQLFDHDDNYQPKSISKQIYPKNNQLVLFPVSPISYHQVQEVTTKSFSRLSINGWFHGESVPSEIVPICLPLSGLYSDVYSSSEAHDINLNEYINEQYLIPENVKDIQLHIEEFSEISLTNFFKEEFFEEVSSAFLEEKLIWKSVGPPNRNCYQVLENHKSVDVLNTLIELFKSKHLFKLLECYTELEFSNHNAGMKYELQKWSSGCYSLLSDYEWNSKQELDVILYFKCKNVVGGQIHYVSQEEEVQQALVTLGHTNNTLNLVYRDSARINCYVSRHTHQPFYALICSYTEDNK